VSAADLSDLPEFAPVPRSALGPAVNEQGYFVDRVERNMYWVTDGTYQCAFLTTSDGVVLLDAPATIGNNTRRCPRYGVPRRPSSRVLRELRISWMPEQPGRSHNQFGSNVVPDAVALSLQIGDCHR
jgi:hypothetical protein